MANSRSSSPKAEHKAWFTAPFEPRKGTGFIKTGRSEDPKRMQQNISSIMICMYMMICALYIYDMIIYVSESNSQWLTCLWRYSKSLWLPVRSSHKRLHWCPLNPMWLSEAPYSCLLCCSTNISTNAWWSHNGIICCRNWAVDASAPTKCDAVDCKDVSFCVLTYYTGYSSNSHNPILKWYPPFLNSRKRGLLIQGWHYKLFSNIFRMCMTIMKNRCTCWNLNGETCALSSVGLVNVGALYSSTASKVLTQLDTPNRNDVHAPNIPSGKLT